VYQNEYYSQCLGEDDWPDWREDEEGGDEGEGEGEGDDEGEEGGE